MYAYIRGRLETKNAAEVIVETAGGVGYLIAIPCSLLDHLPPVGSEVLLYTSLIVRETGHSLVGFLDVRERALFDLLTTVNGVGPKLALSIIGHLPFSLFEESAVRGDVRRLQKVPGVGQKTAERLLLEMRDKLSRLAKIRGSVAAARSETPIVEGEGIVADAVSALVNLGYREERALEAVRGALAEVDGEGELGTLLTVALRQLALKGR